MALPALEAALLLNQCAVGHCTDYRGHCCAGFVTSTLSSILLGTQASTKLEIGAGDGEIGAVTRSLPWIAEHMAVGGLSAGQA